jgi:hypothetical protein
MKMQMFATLNKTNPDTGNIRGINLAAVKYYAIVQATVVAGATNDRA